MVINELKKEIKQTLNEHDTELLITGALCISHTDYILGGNKELSSYEVKKIKELLSRIQSGEPLQYAVGFTEFMSLPFNVKSGVLIPRTDTETLVEKAISVVGDKRLKVLDIGSGSGCVAISIAKYCSNAEVTSVDISDTALKLAAENAAINKVNVTFKKCDILQSIPDSKFDMIVSNPAYIETDVISTLDENVKNFEPHLALDGGADGLVFYRRITSIAPVLLTSGGCLLYEVGHTQAQTVSALMENDFKNIEIIRDLCGIERVIYGIIMQKTPNG